MQTPYTITMLTSNNPDTLRLAQALQSMVKDGGFDLKIKPVEYVVARSTSRTAATSSCCSSAGRGRVDPDANITNFVGTGGSQNVAGYSNPAVDALLTKARRPATSSSAGSSTARPSQAPPGRRR